MAFPIILVNSATGSDTNTSGAGPTTAITGTTAATDATGLIVTLDAGTVLTSVDATGLHALYLNDTTASHRRWSRITATSGSGGATPQVTVSDAYTGSLSGLSWAIGGVRASVFGATSALLTDNGGTTGDWKPGWGIEMQSGHTETVAATVNLRCSTLVATAASTGPFFLRGTPGAATMPLLTFTNNSTGMTPRINNAHFLDFEMRNTNATKTASNAIGGGASTGTIYSGLKIAHTPNRFWKAMDGLSAAYVTKCEFGYTTNDMLTTGSTLGVAVVDCYLHDGGAMGINDTAGSQKLFYGNLIVNMVGRGISSTGTSGGGQNILVAQNTIDHCGGDGFFSNNVNSVGTINGKFANLTFLNNIFSNNTGYGINFSAVGTGLELLASTVRVLGNTFFNNSVGKYNPADLASVDETTVDPTFTNTAGGDYSIGTNLRGKGSPIGGVQSVGRFSATPSYVDPGVAQARCAAVVVHGRPSRLPLLGVS